MKNDEMIRLACLIEANRHSCDNPDYIARAASTFADFVTGADKQPSPEKCSEDDTRACDMSGRQTEAMGVDRPDYVVRMEMELAEVSTRLAKLDHYLASDVSALLHREEIDLLNIQRNAMRTYLGALCARLRRVS